MSEYPPNASSARLLREIINRIAGQGLQDFGGWDTNYLLQELGRRIDANWGDGR